MATRSYIGNGVVYAKTGNNPLIDIGNVQEAKIEIDEDVQEQMDMQSGAGGIIARVSRIKAAKLSLKMDSFSPENMAMATRGKTTTTARATITDEAVTAKLGGLNLLERLQDLSAALTVTNSAGTTTYALGTDYTRVGAGIVIPATGSAITAAQALKVTYTAVASSNIEGLIAANTDYQIVFDGLNIADNGKRVRVIIHRVSLSPTKALDLIGDKFGSVDLTGGILQDQSIVFDGSTSQYFKEEMQN